MIHYVLGNTNPPWLLTTEPVTMERAQRAIAWQRIGQGAFDPPDYWQICTFDKARNAFIDDHGQDYKPNRGCYTVEAWTRICAAIGYETE